MNFVDEVAKGTFGLEVETEPETRKGKVDDVLEACVDIVEGKRDGMSPMWGAAEVLGKWQFGQILETSRMWLGTGPLGRGLGRGCLSIYLYICRLQRKGCLCILRHSSVFKAIRNNSQPPPPPVPTLTWVRSLSD